MFWWNLSVNVAVAIGTIGAVLVALFGQAFRGKFFPPRLSLRLTDGNGEATRVTIDGGRTEQARFYHLVVSNTRRWSPAHEVRIVLLQVEEPGPTGALQVTWEGDIPFGWRHNVLFPVTRTIGADAFADLCSVGQGGWLRLQLLLAPFNLEIERRRASTLVLTLQARSAEVDSPIVRIRVAWDGQWEGGEVEMRRHMLVELN